MPQDHSSWDRKDLLRQRKHERSEQSFGSSFRWRSSSVTSSSSHYAPREFSRWGSGEFRSPLGHGKQGGRHQFVEETGHSYEPSRSNARMFEDDHCRTSASRGEWRYNRNTRDGRFSFGQRGWKCHTWDMNNQSVRTFGRPHDMNNDRSLIDERPYHPSDPRTWDMKNGSLSTFGRPRDMNNGRWSVDERSSHPSDPHATLVDSWGEANFTHQKVSEVSAPKEALKVKNYQNLVDQGPSLALSARSVHDNFSDQPCLKDKHGVNFNSPGRQCNDMKCDQMSADDSALHASSSHADLEGAWRCLRLKDQLDNRDGSNISQQVGRESSLGSIDWKHTRWTRSGSFASRGSGFSHSNSSKSIGAVDSSDQMMAFLSKNVSVIESPSGDATARLSSSYPSEEINSRKKPRLGWGEGLAKYEKKKVEVSDVNMSEDETTILAKTTEEVHPLGTNLANKSPSTIGVSDFGSPTTPSSVACSSSPGMEDKSSGKSVYTTNHTSNQCSSPSPVTDSLIEGRHFNLGKLGNISVEKFGCFLSQLLLDHHSGSEDSSFARLTAMNKLLAWKTDALKALEMTESEIDSLENELRVFMLEAGSHCPHLAMSSPNLGVVANVSEQPEAPRSLSPRPGSCVNETVENVSDCNGGLDVVPIDASVGGVDSSEAVASKFSEPLPLLMASSSSQFVASAESSEDSLEIPPIKTITSFSEARVPAIADGFLTLKGEDAELSSGVGSMGSDGEDVLCAMILASNRKSASEACEVFNKLLPREVSCIDDVPRLFNICRGRIDRHVRRKVEMRRRLLRVKERILVLKLKAFRYSWKKDLQQLSMLKYIPKSQKKCESSLHVKNSGHQKHSTRLRFSFPAAERDSLEPGTDVINYMGKLLLDSQWKPCSDILRMPALILDEKEKAMSRFISSNGLVEDPCAIEKERTMINPWTSEEKEIFLDKLAAYGKDFRKIASYLKQKTTADCVDFYYKNHKSDCFERTKKKLAYGKERKCTYMLAPQKKWKREVNSASLDLLGAVSVIAANASKVASNRPSKRITLGSCSSSSSHSANGFEGCLPNFDLSQRETVATGVCKVDLKLDPTAKETQMYDTTLNTLNDDGNDDDDTCSEESFEQMGSVHWTDEERSAFIQAFSLYGKNFAMVSQCIGTRSQDQCKVFFSKVRKCLGLDLVQPLSGNLSTSVSADNGNNGDRSDTEDPFVVGTSDDLSAKMDMNMPTSFRQDQADNSQPVKLKTNSNSSGQENGTGYFRGKHNSEVGTNFGDVRTDDNQSQRISNDHVVFTGSEECTSCSPVSSGPLSSSPPIPANFIGKTFTERSSKDSEGPGVPLPKHFSHDQDSVMDTANRTSSDIGFCGHLHHVPIEVCMGDPVGVHLSRENSSTLSDSESPDSLALRVEKNNLELDEKRQVFWHGNRKKSDSKQLKVSNSGWSLCMQNSNGGEIAGNIGFATHEEIKSGSKLDVGITAMPLGEGFSLRKCSSLTNNGSTARQPRYSHGENRSVHCRSHSCSLSDTERPVRKGDVKLFGTVLTSNDKGNKQLHNSRQNVKASTLKASNGNINQHDLRNVPITSYGFWDGNRIRTGFASLPDPASLLARYPDAISNHLGVSVLQQRAGNVNEIQVGGLSICNQREMSGSGNGVVVIKQKQGALSE